MVAPSMITYMGKKDMFANPMTLMDEKYKPYEINRKMSDVQAEGSFSKNIRQHGCTSVCYYDPDVKRLLLSCRVKVLRAAFTKEGHADNVLR